jgi:hypothetical protein
VQWKFAREGGKEDWLPPESQRIHSERTERVEVNGESVSCQRYKLGHQEQSKVRYIKEDAEMLLDMGDML